MTAIGFNGLPLAQLEWPVVGRCAVRHFVFHVRTHSSQWFLGADAQIRGARAKISQEKPFRPTPMRVR